MVWSKALKYLPPKARYYGAMATAGLGFMDSGTTIIDLRGKLPRNPQEVHYKTRDESKIKAITWHYSATDTMASLAVIAEHQIERLGSESIVYHIAIQPHRTVLLNDFTDITWQAVNCNTRSIGVVMVGDFRKYPVPVSIQDRAVWMNDYLRRRIPSIEEGWMHKQCKNTPCPSPNGEFMLRSCGLLNGHP